MVAPFGKQKVLNCLRVDKSSWALTSEYACIYSLFSSVGWLAISSSWCLDFPIIMGYKPELWVEINPFSSQLLHLGIFCHSNRYKSRTLSHLSKQEPYCQKDKFFISQNLIQLWFLGNSLQVSKLNQNHSCSYLWALHHITKLTTGFPSSWTLCYTETAPVLFCS